MSLAMTKNTLSPLWVDPREKRQNEQPRIPGWAQSGPKLHWARRFSIIYMKGELHCTLKFEIVFSYSCPSHWLLEKSYNQ